MRARCFGCRPEAPISRRATFLFVYAVHEQDLLCIDPRLYGIELISTPTWSGTYRYCTWFGVEKAERRRRRQEGGGGTAEEV